MIFHGSGEPYVCVSALIYYELMRIAVTARQFDDDIDVVSLLVLKSTRCAVDDSNETSPLSYLIVK